MRKAHLQYLVCPACKEQLGITNVTEENETSITTGTLGCGKCGADYKIIRNIPRFVPIENYASSFGLQWTKHSRTQYDAYSGADISRSRFFEESHWKTDLRGEIILEAGCGSGRFTEHAALTGAMVLSLDYSYAVDANYAANGGRDNVIIVQADLYNMPFREKFFDKLFCFGVLQHTPDVEKAFFVLPRYLKPGGNMVIDVYIKRGFFRQLLNTKYWVRPFTRNIQAERLYKLCEKYVESMWPLATFLGKIPFLGKRLVFKLLIADYRGIFDLPDEKMFKEWAVLDTFDMLSPAHDQPQTIDTVRKWFRDAQMNNVEVIINEPVIVGRGDVSA